ARSNLVMAMRRYGEAVGSFLDALSVHQQLLFTERQLASLDRQQIDLSVQLVQALCGGFQPYSRAAAFATAKAPAE
ncbi:multidrug RND transporter, partial [Pseudomonas aeruginosa]